MVNHNIFAAGSGGVTVLPTVGNFSYGTPVFYPTEPGAGSVIGVDMNGDGITDLVVANAGSPSIPGSSGVSVLIGKPGGTFDSAVNYPLGALALAVTWLYTGHQQQLVLAVSTWASGDAQGEVNIFYVNSDGSLPTPTAYQVGPDPVGLTTSTSLETRQTFVAATSSNDSISLLAISVPTQGGGTFTEQASVPLPTGSNPVGILGDEGFVIADQGTGQVSFVAENGTRYQLPPTSGPPGTVVTVTGTDTWAGASATARLRITKTNKVLLCTTTIDDTGSFSCQGQSRPTPAHLRPTRFRSSSTGARWWHSSSTSPDPRTGELGHPSLSDLLTRALATAQRMLPRRSPSPVPNSGPATQVGEFGAQRRDRGPATESGRPGARVKRLLPLEVTATHRPPGRAEGTWQGRQRRRSRRS